jgi:hypothetical protein
MLTENNMDNVEEGTGSPEIEEGTEPEVTE